LVTFWLPDCDIDKVNLYDSLNNQSLATNYRINGGGSEGYFPKPGIQNLNAGLFLFAMRHALCAMPFQDRREDFKMGKIKSRLQGRKRGPIRILGLFLVVLLAS
jgi:hypothetical protein